ncbi:hypothetical protein LCGC14_1109770 [marine sediment metagenome]|uniref:Uncharacterized protein n=1 Tax=marine sediment metagenome TaxID=412755 RepID=A0A0F9QD74_9ZZZZ
MCEWGTDEPVEVFISADVSHTGADRFDIKPIDACIAPIVRALTNAGILTGGSCCGHGKADGWIYLEDGRELVIRKSGRSSCSPRPGDKR